MEEIKKEDCLCNQLTVVKKGFSGYKAIMTFTQIAVVSIIIIGVTMAIQSTNANIDADISNKYGIERASNNYAVIDEVLVSIATTACFLGLFAGTIGMNKLLTVCSKCGKVTPLN
jgi:hypothetical protein